MPATLQQALQAMGLWSGMGPACGVPLTGGVSSDIWRIDLPGGPICVKRALPQLRVSADWKAPVERSAFEARWMRAAASALPGAAPALLGEAMGCIAMTYITAPLWKQQLRDGHVDPGFAARVGADLVRIHAASAADPDTASRFASADIFRRIRLEPYFLATAERHPDRAAALHALADLVERHRLVAVHGDVSPKNILVGADGADPGGPVFLDAECATHGDPAVDLAFCLCHLLLKCVWRPDTRAGFLACFDALADAYLAGVTWELRDDVEARAACLLPGLLLARVDGKSPVEYITTEADRAPVRRTGRALLAAPVPRLAAVQAAWTREF